MRKIFYLASTLVLATGLASFISNSSQSKLGKELTNQNTDSLKINDITLSKSKAEQLYEELNIAHILKYEAFELAMQGFEKLDFKNKNIISIIDFTLPSTEKRLYVIDLAQKKLLYHSIVSHGRNSGEKYAVNFSNKHGSFQSSLGFYTTEGTYIGGNGYSLVLNGLEKGINDQAKARAVVIHGADYCSEQIIKSTGRLGRSYGCPALPRELTRPIINTIKDGSMLFIYADNPHYLAKSSIINKERTLLAENFQNKSEQSL